MNPSLEKAAIAAWANSASIDTASAIAMLDAEGVTAQDFEHPHLKAIWTAVEVLARESRAPDFFAVEGLLGVKVPRELLTEVLLGSTAVRGATERLRALRDVANRRRVIHALASVSAMLGDTSRPVADGIAEAQKALEALHQTSVTAQTSDVDLLTLAEHLEQVDMGLREPVLPTGIDALDAVVGGLQKTLTIIGALPAVGKSALLATLCRNLAVRGVKVGFFSLEDERGWVARRLVSEVSEVPLFVLANRRLTTAQKGRVAAAMEGLHQGLSNLLIDDRPALSTADVVASARAMITRHGCKAIIVDHLGEIRFGRSDRHDLDITDVLQQLRALAKVHGVPVVVACHIKRRDGLLQQNAPVLTDFANSSGIERMARVALALSRPSEDVLAVHVLKQTSGPAGVTVNLEFKTMSGTVGGES